MNLSASSRGVLVCSSLRPSVSSSFGLAAAAFFVSAGFFGSASLAAFALASAFLSLFSAFLRSDSDRLAVVTRRTKS